MTFVHIHPPMLSIGHGTLMQYRLDEAVGRPRKGSHKTVDCDWQQARPAMPAKNERERYDADAWQRHPMQALSPSVTAFRNIAENQLKIIHSWTR